MNVEKEILQRHFGPVIETDTGHLFSAFRAALNDARLITGRSMDDGSLCEDPGPRPVVIWLGTLGYMALLDQIGTCFKPTGAPDIRRNSIVRALKYFASDLEDDQIDALYALRCSFAHDYGLNNVKKRKDGSVNPNGPHHSFTVIASIEAPLIALPSEPWNGDYLNEKRENATVVNLVLFCNLVEEVCARLIELQGLGQLEVILENGIGELKSRYGFYSGSNLL